MPKDKPPPLRGKLFVNGKEVPKKDWHLYDRTRRETHTKEK